MAFSTSGRVRAWRFEDLNVQLIAKSQGWRSKDVDAQLAKLRQQRADPAWIDATLARLPVPALALLATLVDAHGHETDEQILAEASRIFSIPKDPLVAAASVLLDEILIVVLTSPRGQMFSLVEPSAALLAERLRDVQAPSLPEGVPFVASERLDDGRALLAACGALRHVDVKLTQDGLPHRGAIKRLAKTVGIAETKLEHLLVLGLDLRLLAPSDDEGLLRPVTSRLCDLARGVPPAWSPVLAKLVETLRTAGVPVSAARIDSWRHDVAMVTYSVIPDAQQLGSIPGLANGRCGDMLALVAVPLAGSPAVTITPSFEVFVPPEARHEDIVAVLGCAELVRIDRVIVARITKASIQRAVGSGTTTTSLVASLAGACRTPVPQNVAAAIEDWATGQHAVTALGRVIVVPAADEARVVAALAPQQARAIAPGVIVVRAETSQRLVTTALARLGITTRAAEAQDPDRDGGSGPSVSPQRIPMLATGDSALRRRFADYRAGAPAELAKVAKVAKLAKLAAAPAHDDEHDDEHDEPLTEVQCSDRAIALIEGWEDDRNCRLPDEIAGVVATLLDVIPEVDQKFLLAAKNRRQIIERTTIVINQRGGLEAFLAKNRDLVSRTVGPEVIALIEAARQPRPSSPPPPPASSSLAWYSDDLAARLAAAARASATYSLDLGDGRAPTVRLRKLIERGTVTMVLGEDVADDSAVAVPLHSIRRIAAAATTEPPTAPSPRGPWSPLPGQPVPAGHLPCPCGSGERYRACCRRSN